MLNELLKETQRCDTICMWDHIDNFRTLLGMESLEEVIKRGEDSLRVLFSFCLKVCEDKSESM